MLTRVVNGQTVTLSADEEQALLAEWAANRSASAQAQADADTLAANKQAYSSDTNFATLVQQLRSATPAQITTYVANHSTVDAGTQAILVKILVALGSIL